MATPKLKKVMIGTTDVSAFVMEYKVSREYSQYVASASIVFSQGLNTLLTINDELVGSAITIQRGVASATEKYIFRGEIKNIEFTGATFEIECMDKLYEAIRTYVTYSYDINNDSEAGVISEIFKDLINSYTSLTANATSVQASGSLLVLDKFVCRDTPIYERLSDLAKAINWQFYYDPSDDLIYFEPKGFVSSTTIFTVGSNVTKVPKWNYNSDQLANKITVRGAEQLAESTQFFNGDGTNDQEIQLLKTPVSVKAYVGAADYNGTTGKPSLDSSTLKEGGKSGSTSGTYYYSYDEDSKIRKIKFGGTSGEPSGVPSNNTNNIEVFYTWKMPVPVVVRNQVSIDKYGLHEKIVVKSDIKNVSDAEVYAQKQLDKFGVVFATTELLVIEEEDIDVGRLYTVVDNINNINGEYLTTKLELLYPNTEGDKVTIGDELWKTDDWDTEVWDRLKRLEEQQTETTDLLIDLREFSKDILYERRYFLTQKKDRSVDGINTFVLGHPTFGILGTQKLGDAGTALVDYALIQGNNEYKEYLYDEVFIGTGSTISQDTTNRKVTF